jgi:catechol 2,3-dioxygenase-like lactoylglutathione lyase family enzyme
MLITSLLRNRGGCDVRITRTQRLPARCCLRLRDGCHSNGHRLGLDKRLKPVVLRNQSLCSEFDSRCNCSKSTAKTPLQVEMPVRARVANLQYELGDFRIVIIALRRHSAALAARARAHNLRCIFRRKVKQGHDQVESIGHVNLRVADQEVSKWFYRDLLGFCDRRGGPGARWRVHDTGRQLSHARHRSASDARDSAAPAARANRPRTHRVSSRQLHSLARRLRSPRRQRRRDPASHHINQRSFYFADPDGNTLEIYYELPHALRLFPDSRADQDEALKVSGPGEPLPDWLLEDWPPAEMKARIASLRRAPA